MFILKEAELRPGRETPHGPIVGIDGGWVALADSDVLWRWELIPNSRDIELRPTIIRATESLRLHLADQLREQENQS